MRVFQRVLIMSALIAGCGEEAAIGPVEEAAATQGFEPEPDSFAETTPSDHLCIDEEALLGSDIVLLDAGEHPWCEPLGQELPVTVRKEWPQRVVLHGELHIEYCVEVERTSGYLTISHERGTVRRRDNVFTWCITTHTGEPEEMTLVALTPEAKCRLVVP